MQEPLRRIHELAQFLDITGIVLESNVFLRTLPDFLTTQSIDPFEQLCKQAADQYLTVRKKAVAQATVMLKQGQHREKILALLEDLAKYDLIMSVRKTEIELLQHSVLMLSSQVRKQEGIENRD